MGDLVTSWLWQLKDQISGPLNKVAASVESTDKKMDEIGKSTTKLGNIFGGLGGKLLVINQVAEGMERVKGVFDQVSAPGVAFEDSLKDLSAITGVTGEKLEQLGEQARKTNLQFGGNAADKVEAYKVLLSKLGPDIAKSPEALDAMGKSVAILSKTMGDDAVGAVNALSTGLLQFQVDLSNPNDAAKVMWQQMNVMAAAAKEGAAEVPQITAALEQAGVAASSAHVSFTETNSAIQALAQGGKVGSEAGVALRNVMNKMAQGRFIPKDTREALEAAGVSISKLADKTVPFTQRLAELRKIQNDTALVTKFFGEENSAAAGILIRSIGYQEEMTTKITGTNTAVDQAKIKMESGAQSMMRFNALLQEAGIRFYNATRSAYPFILSTLNLGTGIANLWPALTTLNTALGWLKTQLISALKGMIQFTFSVATGTWQIIRFGAMTLWSAVYGVGNFILRLITGRINVLAFARSLVVNAIPALWTFTSGLALAGWNALKSGAAFIWSAVTALPGMIASLVAATAAQWGLNIAMDANPIGAIILGVMALIGAIVLLVKNWDTVKAALIKLGMFVLKYNPFTFLFGWLMDLFPGLKKAIFDMFDKVVGWVKWLWDAIKSVWNTMTGQGGDVEIKTPSFNPDGSDASSGLAAQPGQPKMPAINQSSIGQGLASVSGDNEKVKNVRVTIQKIVGIENVHVASFKEGISKSAEIVKAELIAAIRDAEIVLSNG